MSSDNPFVDRLKGKSSEHLKMMVNSTSGFQPRAVQAAEYILEQREKGIDDFQEPVRYSTNDTIKPTKKSRSLLETKSILFVIIALQIVTAFGGVFLLFDILQEKQSSNVLLLVFGPVFVFDIAASVLLFKKKILGLTLSFIAQLIHSIKFSLFGLTFITSIPLYFYITIEFFGLGFDAGFGTMNTTFLIGPEESFISINLITAFFATILLRVQKDPNLIKDYN